MQLPFLDLIFLGILILFALWGGKKGLVLSLCSLVALVVAVVGAGMVTDLLAPALAQQAAPMVERFLSENLDTILAGQAGEQSGFLWVFVRQALAGTELAAEAAGELIAKLAVDVSVLLLKPLLYAIAFALILILWFFISHALDLVAKLPVLSTLNSAGGLLLGAAEGAVLSVVAFLLVQAFLPELIPQEWVDGSYLLNQLEGFYQPVLF